MAKDWTKIYKKYKGLWVALAADEETVISSGKTALEALVKAQKNTSNMPFLTWIPLTLETYVGAL